MFRIFEIFGNVKGKGLKALKRLLLANRQGST